MSDEAVETTPTQTHQAAFDPNGYPLGFWIDGDAPADAVDITADEYTQLVESPGSRWVDGVVIVPFASPPPFLDAVPAVVTLAQARAALMQSGHFAAVDAAIRDSGNAIALMAWEYTNTVSRTGVLVQALAPATGLTSEQIDDLFRAAAGINL